MADGKLSTLDVFGTSRDLPENYVVRSHVDEKFVASLAKDRHVVIHGSSKQGKTSLRKMHLKPEECKIITCQRSWKLVDIHDAILKLAGYELTLSSEHAVNGSRKVSLSSGVGAKSEGEDVSDLVRKRSLEITIENTTDVIEALRVLEFNKFFVIEEFHYLEEDVQIAFAQGLKAFHEQSKVCFIIVGVWLESDRLISLNNDLSGRVVSVDADKWLDQDIDELFKRSESLLNISFAPGFKKAVRQHGRGNVFLVQQLCMEACERQGVYFAQDSEALIAADLDVHELIKSVLDEQTGRYQKFLMEFSAGFSSTEFDLYKWMLCPLIVLEDHLLENGVTAQALRRFLERKHPQGKDIKIARLLAALNKVLELQRQKKISPIIIEFDQARNRLKIVDKGFLAWRAFQDQEELLQLADLSEELVA
ncbi:hypothetical protein PshuTeo1_14810 [Pseudomonas hunanensis]|nr:hypothetical protein PshuTeo1_14810 [Pseudomonas hunanensis]